MSVTDVLQNESAETVDALDIPRFNDAAWANTDAAKPSGLLAFTEWAAAGDDPPWPLIRRVEIRNAKLYHPSHPLQVVEGRRYTVNVFTTQKTENSVSGSIVYTPVQYFVGFVHGGPTILNRMDCFGMLTSTLSTLYPSVTAGVPDGALMAKLALGSSDLF